MTLMPTAGVAERTARILIVDDHPALCEGLAHRITAQPDMAVCGEAADVDEAFKKIGDLKPDVIIVDIALRSSDGLELIKKLKGTQKHTRAIVHSMYEESLYADRCLRAGAMGYVNKEANPSEVIKAIREVLAGRVYLSPAMTNRFLSRAVSDGKPQVEPVATLTNRQLEIFRLIGKGKSSSQIASQLHISIHTVETHRENIKRKLGAKIAAELNRQAVQWVLENG
jgi:DNA-binding NarL/FixJ family response regulator